MKFTITLHETFVGEGCEGKAQPQPAVSIGAGGIWGHAYEEVTTTGGRYVQGGGCMTVGVAGLILGGGFGSFSKAFGLAAAYLLEAEVVTADGEVRSPTPAQIRTSSGRSKAAAAGSALSPASPCERTRCQNFWRRVRGNQGALRRRLPQTDRQNHQPLRAIAFQLALGRTETEVWARQRTGNLDCPAGIESRPQVEEIWKPLTTWMDDSNGQTTRTSPRTFPQFQSCQLNVSFGTRRY